jgi:hypothetical protein
MPEDLPSLVVMDPIEDIPNRNGVFQQEQKNTVPFSVQEDSIIYLYWPN